MPTGAAMAKRDYYEVLALAKSATLEEIKASYRTLAKQYHPDRNPGDKGAEDKFKEAAEAFEVLADPNKRQRYDRHGHAGLDGAAMHDFRNASAEDVFSVFEGLFGGGLFGDFFGKGAGGGRQRGPRKGQDVLVRMAISLEEAVRGAKKTIEFRRSEHCGECAGSGARKGTIATSCSYCGGQGQVFTTRGFFQVAAPCPSCQGQGVKIADPCPKCKGGGRLPVPTEVSFDVPPGVDSGMRMTLRAQGEAGDPGAPRGSLVVEFRVNPHPLFDRRGNDLIASVPIGFPLAALGGDVEVPTLDGRSETIHVPKGTQYGEVHRLRGRGAPDVNGRGRGDLLVELSIEVPKELTPRQEQLMRELAELDKVHVAPQRKGFLERLRDFFTLDGDADEEGANAKAPEPSPRKGH